MPTYREDIHLGHKVSTIETDDIGIGAITAEKMADGSISTSALQDKCVTEPKIDDDAVSTRTIEDGAVTEPKLGDDSVSHRTIQPDAVHGDNIKPGEIKTKHLDDACVDTRTLKDKAVTTDKLGNDVQSSIVFPVTNILDEKYANITNELYDMVRSLQVGGVALSSQFGDRTDIGITQKSLTIAFGKILDILGDILGKDFMDYKFSVNPTTVYAEGEAIVNVTADSSLAISNFDSIKIYVNDELKAESGDITRYVAPISISESAEIRCVGVIMGKTIIKSASVFKETPFFMGSGMEYQDVMVPENHKELVGTLEGDYDTTVNNDGEHIFIIIPISRKDEFRRADMNDVEIPFEAPVEMNDFVVYKSLNIYQAGTYNVDININS